MSNRERFLTEYRAQLALAREQFPEEYVWPESELERVYGRMVEAIDRGSYSKDSRALRAVCRLLRIKHTYTGIRAYLEATP